MHSLLHSTAKVYRQLLQRVQNLTKDSFNLQEIKLLRSVSFDRNIVQFCGACLSPHDTMMILEYMAVCIACLCQYAYCVCIMPVVAGPDKYKHINLSTHNCIYFASSVMECNTVVTAAGVAALLLVAFAYIGWYLDLIFGKGKQ